MNFFRLSFDSQAGFHCILSENSTNGIQMKDTKVKEAYPVMDKMTIKDVLSVKYLSGLPKWSQDGQWLLYQWNDGGVHDLWLINIQTNQPTVQLTHAKSGVSDFTWRPNSREIAYVMDGALYLAKLDQPITTKQVTWQGGIMGCIAFSPNGEWLAFTDAKTLMFLQVDTGLRKDIKPLGDVFARRFSQTVHQDSFCWNPDGSMFLYTWVDAVKKPWLAICTLEDGNVWRSAGHSKMISSGEWLASNSFIFLLNGAFGAEYISYHVTIPARETWQNYQNLGIVSRFTPQIEVITSLQDVERSCNFQYMTAVRPGGNELLLALELDGFLHHYLYSIPDKTLTQLTFGHCEDLGQAGDQADWSPDGRYFLYASNRNQRIERQIWCYDTLSGCEQQLTNAPVTNLAPVFAPDGQSFVYTHCDKRRNGDLWLYDLTTGQIRQLTDSMPDDLADKMVESEVVQYAGAEGWMLDAFLYKPVDFDPRKKYPAIVWVHGGPMRQMRGSWHPSATYAHFYAFNQYLANQGFVVLSPNFRGGIGYGRDFRHGLWQKKGIDDTIDIVNGGRYLKQLEFVDPDRVAVYGLSYGGYMTLHALTQFPDVFACGINLAGLWDISQWGLWMRSEYGNYDGDSYFLGDMELHPELWALGSPCTYKNNLSKPLLSLQGTADLNVDITQQDKLIRDCVALGRGDAFQAVYYPGESHTFRYRKTWLDALPRMMKFFNQYLKKE